MVIMCRFDIFNWNGEPHRVDITRMLFYDNLDMSYIYTAVWKQLNAGLAEHWFYSNKPNIEKISLLYNFIIDYLKEGSCYITACNNGWPISNANDEFSNEILKHPHDRSMKLHIPGMGGPNSNNIGGVLNNHYLYKWFFIDTGLLEITKYI